MGPAIFEKVLIQGALTADPDMGPTDVVIDHLTSR